jgi:hypothetical protein
MPQTINELKAEIKKEILAEVKTLISELTVSVNKNFEQIDKNFETMKSKQKELSGRRER